MRGLVPALAPADGIWIHLRGAEELAADARALEARPRAGLPLYGVPFAVKDNIDVAGLPTTAGCPSLSRVAQRSAPVVERLLAAGALLIGKTNLDQLATGLVGVRSPYGLPRNPFDPRYVVGGSSSGSAAAVARGLVSFALGTDTAGSGRVPAAFTNLVGLKPSRGLLSTRGVVPACRSLDCVSIFALGVADAVTVAEVARGHDPADPASRPEADAASFRPAALPPRPRLAVPAGREFFGDAQAEAVFERALATARALGAELVPVPWAPFDEAARLLYEGPWIAERLAPFEALLEESPEALLPVIREILARGRAVCGPDAFRGLHRLEALRAEVRPLLAAVDALLVPTTPTIPTIAAVEADPIRANARLGTYTNFVNLLDLAAIAVPAGFRQDGLPAGVTFVGPRGSDARLAALAAAFHPRAVETAGATGWPLPLPPPPAPDGERLRLAVVGAHLSGQPLNHQLTTRGGRLVRATRTAPCYRLYALPGTPARPGLVRVAEGGAAIEMEVWDLPRAEVGAFLAGVPAPLCIGTVEAEDGERSAGFLCEAYAVAGARDITALGGWRAHLTR